LSANCKAERLTLAASGSSFVQCRFSWHSRDDPAARWKGQERCENLLLRHKIHCEPRRRPSKRIDSLPPQPFQKENNKEPTEWLCERGGIEENARVGGFTVCVSGTPVCAARKRGKRKGTLGEGIYHLWVPLRISPQCVLWFDPRWFDLCSGLTPRIYFRFYCRTNIYKKNVHLRTIIQIFSATIWCVCAYFSFLILAVFPSVTKWSSLG
jgi:hypothetical protein